MAQLARDVGAVAVAHPYHCALACGVVKAARRAVLAGLAEAAGRGGSHGLRRADLFETLRECLLGVVLAVALHDASRSRG